MYHSITFTNTAGVEKNTWDDFYLIPTERPSFSPPETKTRYRQIPGTSLMLDLTDAVKGYPVYKNREGSFSFLVENGHSWVTIYRQLQSFFNGTMMKAVLEDDLFHYYEGRFYIREWNPEKHWSKVTLNYVVSPYKMRIFSTLEDWKWDPFNFDIGVFQKNIFYKIPVSGTLELDLSQKDYIGRKPVCPTFIVSGPPEGIDIRLQNRELNIDVTRTFYAGETSDRRFILSNICTNNRITLVMTGIGTVSIDFRSGGL